MHPGTDACECCVQDGEERLHAFSAANLRAVHAASAESPERAAAHMSRWMLNRGKLPSLDAVSKVRAGHTAYKDWMHEHL